MKRIILLFCLLSTAWAVQAQTAVMPHPDSLRLGAIGMKLDSVAAADKAWRAPIEISVGTMPLPELIRNVAKTGGINIGIKGADGIMATCNFSNAKITDLIYYLCKEYNLDLDLVGNIVSIFPVVSPVEPKIPNIRYSPTSRTLGYDLENECLYDVSKRISDVSGINLIVPQPLLSRRVSGFVGEMPVDQAIAALASTNGLRAKKENPKVWRISAKDTSSTGISYANIDRLEDSQLSVDSLGFITAQIAGGMCKPSSSTFATGWA